MKRSVFCCWICVTTSGGNALADSMTIRLVNPGPGTVLPGEPFALEIRADFDAPLVAAGFALEASGSTSPTMTARSAQPSDPNGLTYLSSISQVPFDSELPHDFSTGPRRELLYDADYDNAPGGPEDGVSPGSDVLIETITLVANQKGKLTISLNDAQAATTTDSGQGTLFKNVSIEVGSVAITIGQEPPACAGDANSDQAVDPLDAGYVLARLGCPVSSGDMQCDAADVNKDHVVDPLDVGFVLARFGSCP